MAFDWSIERLLACGGMAEVLLARDREGRRVVIKRILPSLLGSDEILQAFALEGAVAMRLEHPNIVRVLASGTDDGVPFLVMEWLEGIDLRRLARELGRRRAQLHPAQALAIGAAVAGALGYAHGARGPDGAPLHLVHRDVSPSNILLTRAGEVKLLDFGIAKTRAIATRSGLVVGKPAYMAPEQVEGLHVDPRTDLFALGIVVWELLTGRRLWSFDTVDETVRAVREASVAPPSVHASGISPEADRLVLRLLAKFPSARPGSAEVIADELGRLARAHGSKDPRFELAHLVGRFTPEERQE